MVNFGGIFLESLFSSYQEIVLNPKISAPSQLIRSPPQLLRKASIFLLDAGAQCGKSAQNIWFIFRIKTSVQPSSRTLISFGFCASVYVP